MKLKERLSRTRSENIEVVEQTRDISRRCLVFSRRQKALRSKVMNVDCKVVAAHGKKIEREKTSIVLENEGLKLRSRYYQKNLQ